MAESPSDPSGQDATRPDGDRGEPADRLPGWRVTPARDGAVARAPARDRKGGNARWLVVLFVLVLLAVNFWFCCSCS